MKLEWRLDEDRPHYFDLYDDDCHTGYFVSQHTFKVWTALEGGPVTQMASLEEAMRVCEAIYVLDQA
jgi:hypothetical protein